MVSLVRPGTLNLNSSLLTVWSWWDVDSPPFFVTSRLDMMLRCCFGYTLLDRSIVFVRLFGVCVVPISSHSAGGDFSPFGGSSSDELLCPCSFSYLNGSAGWFGRGGEYAGVSG